MTFEQLYAEQREPLIRRLERMVGSREAAEDIGQEAFTRALTRLPAKASPEHQHAWLMRTASNLAVDELRRRRVRDLRPLDDADWVAADFGEPSWPVQEALTQLADDDRLLLELRWAGGYTHAEIGAVLDISDATARKRMSRARGRFIGAYREASRGLAPLVLLVQQDGVVEPYVEWLEAAGARVKQADHARLERDLAAAQAVVVAGNLADVHPAVYGERPRTWLEDPDLQRDARDMAALRGALTQGLPVLGICRGHQLLNVVAGGTLFQDLGNDRVTSASHRAVPHGVDTAPDSLARSLFGARTGIWSDHHQAVSRLGRAVRVVAESDDGVVEALELPAERFALGVQWHPEDPNAGPQAALVAEALLAAAGGTPRLHDASSAERNAA
jgi:putative glutamine amidotransferase